MYHGPISFALHQHDGSSAWSLSVYSPDNGEGERYSQLSLGEALDVAGACLLHYMRACEALS